MKRLQFIAPFAFVAYAMPPLKPPRLRQLHDHTTVPSATPTASWGSPLPSLRAARLSTVAQTAEVPDSLVTELWADFDPRKTRSKSRSSASGRKTAACIAMCVI